MQAQQQAAVAYEKAHRLPTNHNIFGSPSPPLKVLTTDPETVLALARVTLFGAEASTTTAVVPGDWKAEVICPIFQNGDQKTLQTQLC